MRYNVEAVASVLLALPAASGAAALWVFRKWSLMCQSIVTKTSEA